MKIVNYVIITAAPDAVDRFEEDVIEYLKAGWELYGTPFFAADKHAFCQAMVKTK